MVTDYPPSQLKILVRDSPQRGGGYQVSVLGQDSARVARPGGFPGLAASFQFSCGDIEVELAFFSIDGDRVPIFHQSQRPAYVGFRGDVADDKSMAAT